VLTDVSTGGLDMLEIASGMVFGFDTSIPDPPRSKGDIDAELEQILIPALRRPPCGVAFSGGRDSSAVLAAATSVARLHQLPDPIPITFRFPNAKDTDETSYQESMIRHLGISEWSRIEPGDSLDVLGDASTRLTAQHGLLYPGNIHFLVPMLEVLRGGALLTGVGGDEMLNGHPNHAFAAMLVGKQRPSRALIRGFAKRYLRRERARQEVRQRAASYFRWLVPEARRVVIEEIAQASSADLLFADRHLTSVVYRMRYLHRARIDMTRVAEGFGVSLVQPFLNAGFVGAVAARVGGVGRPTRADLMKELFGGLLPLELNERVSKARFDDVFWTKHAASAVTSQSVHPLSDVVDEQALRQLWSSDAPKGNTYLIVKYLWRLEAEERGPPAAPAPAGSPDY